MKVLFLASGKQPDYMCDMVYHGLKSMPDVEIEELNPPEYMYSSFPNKTKLYGKGFTLYCRLPGKPVVISVWEMFSRIKKRYYDLVVYGSIWRYNCFFRLVSGYYQQEKIIAIDGEDHQRIKRFYVNKSRYFKRELKNAIPRIWPINFAIPEEHVVKVVPDKKKEVAHIIPGKLETYIYADEPSYYQDYRDSVFGVTMKKGGWDCLRHYEILMNGCIPYFVDLENCPSTTMTDFPKEIVLEMNRMRDRGEKVDHPHYIRLLLDHTRNRLTTVQVARKLLKGD
jgi:hypothetical protein